MNQATRIALAAALGNLLQGWDNADIAGALLYITPEFHLNAYLEGILVASSLLGAWFSALCSGPCADWLGRKKVMLISAVLYTLSSGFMFWSPSVGVLILSRIMVGAGIGIAVTIVPLYIAEIAPPDIRGQLSTFPQFLGCGGLFVAYVLCFSISLTASPDWRLMLATILGPSLLYCLLVVFYLPESPRWLVSKGKMLEATKVLQRLTNKIDVSGDLALQVEGLAEGATSLEEWVLEPVNDLEKGAFGSGTNIVTWVAKPGGIASTVHEQRSSYLVDSTVSFIESFQHDDDYQLPIELDDVEEEDADVDVEDGVVVGELDEPLLGAYGSSTNLRRKPSILNVANSPIPSVSIGGGWQLGWKWEPEVNGPNATLKHVYLGSPPGHTFSYDAIPTPALVGPAAQSMLSIASVGPAMIHPSATALHGPGWSEVFQEGVLKGLFIGVTLQVLQQFSGINAVLYYVPQILQQSGAGTLLARLGLGPDSASIFAGGIACLLMLPAIILTMYLMDRSGRRRMLLVTIPFLLLSLVVMVVANTVLSGILKSAASFFGVVLYVCTFVMGLGPIPNIICSEIFPTRVRGVCIGICQIAFWTCNIILTNLFPVLLEKMGLAGIFGTFAVIVLAAWLFTFAKVPETKGLPLELITDLLKAH